MEQSTRKTIVGLSRLFVKLPTIKKYCRDVWAVCNAVNRKKSVELYVLSLGQSQKKSCRAV